MTKKLLLGVLLGYAVAIFLPPQMIFGLFKRQTA